MIGIGIYSLIWRSSVYQVLSKRKHQEAPLTAPIMSANKKCAFEPTEFLATIGEGRRIVAAAKKQTIYAQGAAPPPPSFATRAV
jgi:hypothetical protein